MKEKNNNGVLIGLLIGIIIMLLIFIYLFTTNTISFNTKETPNINEQKDNITEPKNQKIYSADEYITLEDVSFNSKISTKKVKFNYLDEKVTSDFYKEQEEVINSIHPYDGDEFNAEYKLKYFINNNILSVVYTIEQTNEMGTCADKKAVINIDLENNKIISEEELLKKANTSYKQIVEDQYEKSLKSWKELNEINGKTISNYDVTFEDFSNNKSKYVEKGLTKISDVIYAYIENNKIKYDVYTIKMDTLFYPVGKGGCFNWKTVELGDYTN